jgi:hypothetical protein
MAIIWKPNVKTKKVNGRIAVLNIKSVIMVSGTITGS